ncbi:MAG: hypothetical protein QGD90_00300 [Candidatus Hydrogenedentes bacterium]|nr:hypothetical protein [Candidatus Hydrogenedentota bacterium]
MDVVITVPQNFRFAGLRGLTAWCAEGDCAGEAQDSGEMWVYNTWGPKPGIQAGERVYVVCEDRLRGYAPLVELDFHANRTGQGRVIFVRQGGAQAVTLSERITGFRGWRYRWWKREDEIPFPEWRTEDVRGQSKRRGKELGQMLLLPDGGA